MAGAAMRRSIHHSAGNYCVTVRVTWVVCVSVPDVAVTVSGTLFVAGVLLLFTTLAHPASMTPVTSSIDNATMAAQRLSCGVRRIWTPAYSPPNSAASQRPSKGWRSGDHGLSIGEVGGAAPPAVLVIVKVVVAGLPFGVIFAGLNSAVLFAGKPDTLKETALANPSVVGATVIWIIACCPALIVVAPDGPLTE